MASVPRPGTQRLSCPSSPREVRQGGVGHISLRTRPHPSSSQGQVTTAAADKKLFQDCHLRHWPKWPEQHQKRCHRISLYGEETEQHGESRIPVPSAPTGLVVPCGPSAALPGGLLARGLLGLTLCHGSQAELHRGVSPSSRQAGDSSVPARASAQPQGAPPPPLGTKAPEQAGAAGAVLGHEGGRSKPRSPRVSAVSDWSSLAVRVSIRCFRMLAMVSRACSRACLYRKCRGPGVPRRSASSGSR